MVKSMFINSTYVLNGLGIFIGRFLRFHTVHLITRPFTIITEVISALNDSSLIFISLMMLLQFVILLFIKGIRMAH